MQAPVYRSVDDGATWTEYGTGLSAFFVVYSLSTADTLLLASDRESIYTSSDGGITWHQSGSRKGILDVVQCGSLLVGATYTEGVIISSNAGTDWTPSNDGLPSSANTFYLCASNTSLHTSVGTRTYRSLDQGTTWSVDTALTNPAAPMSISSMTFFDGSLYAGTNWRGVYISRDNGNSWQQPTANITTGNIVAFATSGPTMVAGGYTIGAKASGLYYSADSGMTWTAADFPHTVRTLTVRNGRFFAGTDMQGIFISDDGRNWKQSNSGLYDNSYVSLLASNKSGIFAIVGTNILFVSRDNGESWKEISFTGSAYGIPVSSMLAYHNLLFLGGNSGIYYSNDYGTTWQRAEDTLKNLYIDALATNGDYLFAGVRNNAVWRCPLSDFGALTEVQDSGPANHHITVAPHPLASVSVLELCSTCELRNASFTLSALSGRTVHTLHNLYGTTVSIERGTIPAGIYVYSLTQDGSMIASGTIAVE